MLRHIQVTIIYSFILRFSNSIRINLSYFAKFYLNGVKENKSRVLEIRRIIGIAIPVTVGQLGHMSVGVADSIMLGNLGGVELAASTFGLSVFVPFMMMGVGISYGVSPAVAKANGEHDHKALNSLILHGLVLNTFIGLLFSLVLWYFSGSLKYFGQPDEIVSITIVFFQWMALCMFPLMIFQSLKQFAEGLSVTKPFTVISLSGNLINILLNYLLIFGKFGFPKMGVEGAAIATFVARVYMASMVFVYYYFSPLKIYIQRLNLYSLIWSKIISLAKVSLPIGLQMVLEVGAFGFAAIMTGWIDTNSLAAHQIALNLAAITYMAATGIASAASVRVGFELGKKNRYGLRNAGVNSVLLVILFMTVNAVLFFVFRNFLPTIYIKDLQIVEIASSLLLITAFFQISDGVQAVGLGALRGLSDVKMPTLIAFIAYWVIALPVGYVLAFYFKLGVEGIWYGLLSGLTIAAILLIKRFLNISGKNFAKLKRFKLQP